MVKFENVEVLAYLEKIMQRNTGYFQSDFEIDKKIIAKAAAQPAAEDRTLLWMSRPSGTHCFRERDVFVKDTAAHNTWRFHKEQTRDPILAYAVELTGKMDGKLMGNLYELDYPTHYERIKERSLPAAMNMLVYEKGTRMLPAGRAFDGSPDRELGKFLHFEAIPNDPELLTRILQEEKRSHDRLPEGSFQEHIAALWEKRIEAEARHIIADIQRLAAPNSTEKTHYTVQVSPAFMMLASSKDMDRLAAMLPYKTLVLTSLKDRHGVFAQISREENRDKDIRRPRPSIRAQLKQDKGKAAPKKAAKTKSHEMEV